MTDESREAEIRRYVEQDDPEAVKDHSVLLRIIDALRARLAAAEQERDALIAERDRLARRLVSEENAYLVFKSDADTLRAERDAALAEVKALREVARKYGLVRRECPAYGGRFVHGGYSCRGCKSDWGGPCEPPAEWHHNDCPLAALDAKEKTG